MTENLKAISHLSDQFAEAVRRAKRYDSWDVLMLITNSPLIPQGEKVLRMYQAETTENPEDSEAKLSMARHLYRMCWMYYDAVLPQFLGDKGSNESSFHSNEYASRSCDYAVKSYQMVPNSAAAFILADLFRIAGFYGSAMHWYELAAQAASEFDEADVSTRARAAKLDLQADGKNVDPPLRRQAFPTMATPGVLLESQPQPDKPNRQTNTAPHPVPGNSTTGAGSRVHPPASVNWKFVGAAAAGFVLWYATTNGLFLLLGLVATVLGFARLLKS